MLHEILLALLGYTGSIIVEVPQEVQTLTEQDLDEDFEQMGPNLNRNIRFQVNPSLTWLSKAEIEQLNQLV